MEAMTRSRTMRHERRRERDNTLLAIFLGLVALALILFGVLIGRASMLF